MEDQQMSEGSWRVESGDWVKEGKEISQEHIYGTHSHRQRSQMARGKGRWELVEVGKGKAGLGSSITESTIKTKLKKSFPV